MSIIKLGSDIRNDFPIFARNSGAPFIYLDSAATSLKPMRVCDAMREYYEGYSVNVARGVYPLSEKVTQVYEDSRSIIADFIGASLPEEIIFVRNATEALNLITVSFGGLVLGEGDGVLLSEMEHHANLVPWQQMAKTKKCVLHFLPVSVENGELEWNPDTFVSFLKERKIKIVSLIHVSNVLGTINPIKEIVKLAHIAGCVVVVDASQSVPHMQVDVQDLGADFLVFSGHKMFGPTGIGVLWGRYELLDRMPPYQTGGEMIQDVGLKTSTFQDPPHRFEAGTPHIAGVIGLAEAARYLQEIGMDRIRTHEKELLSYAYEKLIALKGIHILGPRIHEKRSGVIAFTFDAIHAHDVGSFVAQWGVMIRVGDHCAKPLHKKLGIAASSRISISLYNDRDDIDMAVDSLQKMINLFM
ncbi:MAG: SufS family cysteine desulfurase [Candidatus Sungbacteria bacterium]|nr:SufS family cysteine desulfurase [bacterium]MDZ4285836.1 SufS family cysteine desulfurase [Candidatus Sungbacteria bacterium]